MYPSLYVFLFMLFRDIFFLYRIFTSRKIHLLQLCLIIPKYYNFFHILTIHFTETKIEKSLD